MSSYITSGYNHTLTQKHLFIVAIPHFTSSLIRPALTRSAIRTKPSQQELPVTEGRGGDAQGWGKLQNKTPLLPETKETLNKATGGLVSFPFSKSCQRPREGTPKPAMQIFTHNRAVSYCCIPAWSKMTFLSKKHTYQDYLSPFKFHPHNYKRQRVKCSTAIQYISFPAAILMLRGLFCAHGFSAGRGVCSHCCHTQGRSQDLPPQ